MVLCRMKEMSPQVSLVAKNFADSLRFNTVCAVGEHTDINKASIDGKTTRTFGSQAREPNWLPRIQTGGRDESIVSCAVWGRPNAGHELRAPDHKHHTAETDSRVQYHLAWFHMATRCRIVDSCRKVNTVQKLYASRPLTKTVDCCEHEENRTKIFDFLLNALAQTNFSDTELLRHRKSC